MPGDGSVHDHRDDRGARESPDNGSSPGVGAGERHVLALLQRIHSRLADRAGQLPSDVVDRRSFCSEWSIAQVYSHLGSGAEIGALALSAAREGNAPPDPWRCVEPRGAVASEARAPGMLVSIASGCAPMALVIRKVVGWPVVATMVGPR